MKKIALFPLAFFFFFGQVSAATTTVGLFDLSGSVSIDNSGSEGKDSPLNKNLIELGEEINRLKKGDTIIVLGFGKKSDVTLLKATMPKQAGPLNGYLSQTKEAAKRKFRENLLSRSKSVDNSMTDVIGACFRASRLFGESQGLTEKRLFLYSDMLDNENLGLSLNRIKSVGSHKGFLRRLEGKNIGYPNLKEVEVTLFCCFSDLKGITTVETEIAIKELKAFWVEFFKRSGATVKSIKTSY